MYTAESFQLIDRIPFGDKEFQVGLVIRPGLAPQVQIHNYNVVQAAPGIRLMSITKFRLRTAVAIAEAILDADDLYHDQLEADRVAALTVEVSL